MNGVFTLKDGNMVPANIRRMYDTHGPYMMDEQRLDMLTKVTLLVDASTTTSYQTGTESSTAKTSSIVGRSVVGWALTGGAGAIIGGVTAKRSTTQNSTITQDIHTNLTVMLEFLNAAPVHVNVTDLASYHLLLEQVECEPTSDYQLQVMEEAARQRANDESDKRIRWERVDEILSGEKPKLNEGFREDIGPAIGVIGLIFGLIYGDSGITKIFFGIAFCIILLIVTGIPLSLILDKRDQEANEKFQKKRQDTYNSLYSDSM